MKHNELHFPFLSMEGGPTPAAASAAASSPDDFALGKCIETVDQLITVLGFDADLANIAVGAVGPDLSQAYNWILDRGHEDRGGPVVPRLDCPHIARHMLVDPDSLRIDRPCGYHADLKADTKPAALSAAGLKSETGDDGTGSCPAGENWICLHCGETRCSRYVNGHALAHWARTKAEAAIEKDRVVQQGSSGEGLRSDDDDDDDDTAGHCIAVSLADLSIWCYECNVYLKHPSLEVITKRLEKLKFPQDTEGQEDQVSKKPVHDGVDLAGTGQEEEKARDSNSDSEGEKSREASDISRRISPSALAYLRGMTHGAPSVDLPFTLPKNLDEIAKFILSDQCKLIAILAGAGMSKSSGIPDFRSSGGMYDTLRPELLTASEEERYLMSIDPTTVFEKDMFLQNPLPCLELKRPFILGTVEKRWRATIAHRFVELLHKKTGKLSRLYTQNIDGLESQCRYLPSEKVVGVHGSMHKASCEICGAEADFEQFCEDVRMNIKDISRQDPSAPPQSRVIPCKTCARAAVKPTVVLFRSSLPEEFFVRAVADMPNVDLLIVIGTSLMVAPANTLVYRVPPTCLRMIVNNEPVGMRLGINYGEHATRDFFANGNCDDVFLDLICHLDWLPDLAKFADDLPASSASLLRDRLVCMGLDDDEEQCDGEEKMKDGNSVVAS